MRQISPDKKRTYVYSKTQGRLKPNASTFHLKRPCVSIVQPSAIAFTTYKDSRPDFWTAIFVFFSICQEANHDIYL